MSASRKNCKSPGSTCCTVVMNVYECSVELFDYNSNGLRGVGQFIGDNPSTQGSGFLPSSNCAGVRQINVEFCACSMPPSPWGLVSADLFDAIFPFLAQDDKVLAKARLVNRLWRARADARVEELEPRQRVAEPKLSQLLRRFTGLTAINAVEPWRIRISDETIPALLVSSPTPCQHPICRTSVRPAPPGVQHTLNCFRARSSL